MLNKNDLRVGMRVFVFENGKSVDSGTIIAIHNDGFVDLVDGEEGFSYDMDSVEFAEITL